MDNNSRNKFVRIKLAICFILASFAFYWGCSNMQSVRHSPYKRLYPTPKEFKQEVKDDKRIEFPLTSSTDTKVNTFGETQEVNTASEQWVHKDEINELHEQIIELKKELVLLRENINSLEEKLEFKSDGQSNAIVGDVEYSSPNINNSTKYVRTQNNKKANKKHKKSIGKSVAHSSLNKDNTHPQKTQNSKERRNNSNEEIEKEFLENLNTALTNIKEKKYDIALNNLERLEQSTNDVIKQSIIHYWKGETFFLMRQYPTSLDYFLKVQNVERAPKKDKASLMIAECYTRMGKLEEAKKSYKKFIEDFPFSEFAPRARKMIQQL